MKALALALWLVGGSIASGIATPESPEFVESRVINHIEQHLKSFDPFKLPESERLSYLAALSSERLSKQMDKSDPSVWRLLMELGHEPTMHAFAKEFDARAGKRDFEFMTIVRQPKLIALLSPHIFKQQDFFSRDGIPGTPVYPAAYEAARLIRNQLIICALFPPSTREWARMNPLIPSAPDDFLGSYRELWTRNEHHFRSGNYRAIYPPGMEPPPEKTRNVPAIAMQLKDRSVAKGNHVGSADPATAPLQSPTAGSDETASARANPKAVTDDGSPILLLLLVLVTGGAIWFFLRRP